VVSSPGLGVYLVLGFPCGSIWNHRRSYCADTDGGGASARGTFTFEGCLSCPPADATSMGHP
jgi:hypothetical protein